MQTSKPSTMPLSEHDEALTQTNDPERHDPDCMVLDAEPQEDDRAAGAEAIVTQSASELLELPPKHWLSYFQQSSRLLLAVIEPITLTFAVRKMITFCQMVAVDSTGSTGNLTGNLGHVLEQRLSEADNTAIQRLYRRHLLHRVLQRLYQIKPPGWRLLDEPVMIALQSPLYPEPRYIEFWLRSDQLTLARVDPQLDEFAALGLAQMTAQALEVMLT